MSDLDDLPPPPSALDALPPPPMSFMDKTLDVAKGVGKGVVERAAATAAMPLDALAAAGNLLNEGINKIFGTHLPQALTYSEALDKGLSAAVGPTKTTAGKAVQFIAGMGPTAKGIEQTERALFRMAPSLIARWQIAGKNLPEAERIARQSVDAGFIVTPSELPNAPVGRLGESMVGKARSEEEASAHNWDRTQELARNDFHLPEGTEFTEGTYDKLKQPGYDAYQNLQALKGDDGIAGHPFNVTLTYLKDIGKAGEVGGQAAVDFPGKPDSRVLELRGQFSQWRFTAPGAVQKIKELRATWKALLRGGKSEDQALARAHKDIADALEKELGEVARRGGQPQLLKEYQNARRYLAKVYAYEDSTALDGQIDARSLANQYRDGAQLDGNAKIIAEAAIQHPKNFQNITKKGRMGPYTVHDLWMMAVSAGEMASGGAAAGAAYEHHPGAAIALGTVAASRPVVRAALRTKPVQRFMTRPTSKKVINRLVGKHGTVGNVAGAVEQMERPDLGDQSP